MNEKIATNDILSGINSALNILTYSIQHANNKEFRDTLIQFRNKFENVHWDLYLIAKEKQYYVPAAPGGESDVQQVKQVACK
ncbi:MAG: spore coat protein [Clostridia bacterium]|nr:spore coat protein [Clostridia bacterium]